MMFDQVWPDYLNSKLFDLKSVTEESLTSTISKLSLLAYATSSVVREMNEFLQVMLQYVPVDVRLRLSTEMWSKCFMDQWDAVMATVPTPNAAQKEFLKLA